MNPPIKTLPPKNVFLMEMFIKAQPHNDINKKVSDYEHNFLSKVL